MAFILKKYEYLMTDLADPRVKEWIGFSGPGLSLAIIGFYLLSIYAFLPAYMKHRKPYELKTFIYYYNIFQIVSCSVLIYGVATSGWTTTYSWGCQPTDYSSDPEPLRMLTWCYYGYILKGIELIETAIFILRKKYNQASKLHVYHHASSFLLVWIGVKYVGGGMSTFAGLINCSIHVLMYTYYLLASLGPEWQKRMNKWKPKLTILQMVQFCLLIGHSLQALHPDCRVPKVLVLIYIPNVLLVFRMFWQFYQENYNKKKHQV